MSPNGQAVTEKKVQRNRAKDLAEKLKGIEMLGEIITWQVRRDQTRTYQDVIDALKQSKLDEKVARKILPRFAFTRACKKLKEQAIFDVVKDGTDTIRFQMTKKSMKSEEWVYAKDVDLVLDKVNGTIQCKRKELEALAQKLLDQALEIRTTADITHIVQKLFEKNGDLFSIRDQGGVYFVPKEYREFVLKIENFIGLLGGELGRFPVPSGTPQGDRSIKTSIADAFQNLIGEHEIAIEGFTINTRSDTMKAAGDRIKATRVKIEAYANYLKDKSAELLKSVDAANKKLMEQIEKLAEDKENAPEGPESLFGHSVTRVMKWMGKNDWQFHEAKKVLTDRGFQIQESTIRGQLWCGKTGKYGDPAELKPSQIKELEKERKLVKV